MPKFKMVETIDSTEVITARLGTGTYTASAANIYTDTEVGKFVKLGGANRYVLCAAGDAIEGRITSIEVGRNDDYSFGGVANETAFLEVVLDGLQATPGTGVVAIGDYVVCGTVVAKGTAIVFPARAKVCKATSQSAAMSNPYAWRVVSIGATGADGVSGAVGVSATIQSTF